ncbi:MAG: hypothetical protein IPL28_04385 [Chloroflexi bacterium]|nr:hypothetical protein [Chloroflexota bacterium]
MASPTAAFTNRAWLAPVFWCNAPALENTNQAKRRFVMMGFSYQRGVGEMLENMGHRAESIMKHVYRNHKGKRICGSVSAAMTKPTPTAPRWD